MPNFVPIKAGMHPDEAISLMLKQCRALWIPHPDRRDQDLAHLRRLLSSPVTEHQASLLTNVAFSISSLPQLRKAPAPLPVPRHP